MSFCFAKSVDALGEPEFKAPIVEAMEVSSDCLILFKHFPWLQSIVFLLPRSLTVRITPPTSGIIRVMKILSAQVKEILANPSSLKDFSHPVIFHALLSTEGNQNRKVPNERSLLQEAQSLLFGGSDTLSNQIMLGTWSLLENPDLVRRLKKELLEAWPVLQTTPRYEDLEKLPFLVIYDSQDVGIANELQTAVIKESLRIGPGGIPGVLSRVVPRKGATISGSVIPEFVGPLVLLEAAKSHMTRVSLE
jgi:cytochrome P450